MCEIDACTAACIDLVSKMEYVCDEASKIKYTSMREELEIRYKINIFLNITYGIIHELQGNVIQMRQRVQSVIAQANAEIKNELQMHIRLATPRNFSLNLFRHTYTEKMLLIFILKKNLP